MEMKYCKFFVQEMMKKEGKLSHFHNSRRYECTRAVHEYWNLKSKMQNFCKKFMKKNRNLSHFSKFSKVPMQQSCQWKFQFESEFHSFSIQSRCAVLKNIFYAVNVAFFFELWEKWFKINRVTPLIWNLEDSFFQKISR